MKVTIAEDLWWPIPDWLTRNYNVVYEPTLYKDTKRMMGVLKDTDALVIRNRTRIDAALLRQLPQLTVIGRLGVGMDNIDLAACRNNSVRVVAAIGCNANSVAEYVLASVLEHARYLSKTDSQVKAGQWDRHTAMGHEISGRTLGLIGVGDIGQRVAVRALAFGMRVIAYDPFLLKSSMIVQDFGLQLTTLEKLCMDSDYISVHVPLTPETKYLLCASEMARMKDHVVIINTARGGVVNERDLHEALVTNPHRFAILDVREQEPPGVDDPLALLSNTLLTPHISGITTESSERVAEFVLEAVDRVLRHMPAQGVVA